MAHDKLMKSTIDLLIRHSFPAFLPIDFTLQLSSIFWVY